MDLDDEASGGEGEIFDFLAVEFRIGFDEEVNDAGLVLFGDGFGAFVEVSIKEGFVDGLVAEGFSDGVADEGTKEEGVEKAVLGGHLEDEDDTGQGSSHGGTEEGGHADGSEEGGGDTEVGSEGCADFAQEVAKDGPEDKHGGEDAAGGSAAEAEDGEEELDGEESDQGEEEVLGFEFAAEEEFSGMMSAAGCKGHGDEDESGTGSDQSAPHPSGPVEFVPEVQGFDDAFVESDGEEAGEHANDHHGREG